MSLEQAVEAKLCVLVKVVMREGCTYFLDFLWFVCVFCKRRTSPLLRAVIGCNGLSAVDGQRCAIVAMGWSADPNASM